jgi:peptidoglycan/xylan/chitin deacetylase (PgdA/CDA1 family)
VALSVEARRFLRRSADRVLFPVGSLRGAKTPDRLVALTYDDGPDPVGTPAVLEALASLGLKATFFQLAYRAERYPELVRAVLDEGHEIALHGVDHTRLTTVPKGEVRALLEDGRTRLSKVAGHEVRMFRPPYGSQSPATYLATRRAGLMPVVWGPSVRDWVDGAAPDVAARGLTGLHPGSIMLMHDGFEVPPGDTTPEPTFDRGDVTRALVAELRARDYTPVSVSDLVTHAKPWRSAWFRD